MRATLCGILGSQAVRTGELMLEHKGLGFRRVVVRHVMAAFRVTRQQASDDRERTGEILDRVDAWVEEGVLDGERLRGPDLAVASSLALVEYILELQPELRRRPSLALLERVFNGSAAARGRA